MSTTAFSRPISQPTDRTILVVAVSLIFAAGLWYKFIGSYLQFGPLGWLTDNLGLNVGEILAFAALLKIFAGIGKKSILRRADFVLLAVLFDRRRNSAQRLQLDFGNGHRTRPRVPAARRTVAVVDRTDIDRRRDP